MNRVWYHLFLPFCITTIWLIYSAIRLQDHPFQLQEQLHASTSTILGTPQSSLATGLSLDPSSVTAILTVSEDNLQDIHLLLSPFLRRTVSLSEVIIVCPDSILSRVRRQIRKVMAAAQEHDHPELLLRSWGKTTGRDTAVLHAASHITTDWVLLLDDNGLRHVDNTTLDALLNRRAGQILYGPIDSKGSGLFRADMTCTSVMDTLRSSGPFLPPFLFPMALFPENAVEFHQNVWAVLHHRLLDSLSVASQDSRHPPSHLNSGLCISSSAFLSNETKVVNPIQPNIGDNMAHTSTPRYFPQLNDTAAPIHQSGNFAVILPSVQDLDLLSPGLCKLLDHGHQLRILIQSETRQRDGMQDKRLFSGGCHLSYGPSAFDGHEPKTPPVMISSEWPDVILTLAEEPSLSQLHVNGSKTTLVHIPREDLPYSFWMGTLSLKEWQNWNVPRIDICVITKDRPRSLRRLLSSLTAGKYFGDRLNLRINMEQSSDIMTMQTVENFNWKHGSMFVHHRVIHGGLLPAVVESWYPQSNNSYGLLLEDDIELSPLFYAWIKMSLLRYKHGEQANRAAPQLFGISLYQQKIIELRPEGRQPFDAKALFVEHGLPPTIPYLSQIPCSWGAVYFPEHWKEFHAYLAWRLSEFTIKISQNVVPDVRSNKWTKSWKKYFIELAYLRGYVMLYPNYDDFVSLSTNHLEVGSHVRRRSKEQKEQFLLPLMTLSSTGGKLSTGLLDMPKGTLPDWNRLPVLNLTGSLTTLETLARVGLSRKAELRDPTCSIDSFIPSYDVRDLACSDGISH